MKRAKKRPAWRYLTVVRTKWRYVELPIRVFDFTELRK